MSGPLPPAGTPFPCTPGQARVLELAARGLVDKEIARVLGLSPRQVRLRLEQLHRATGEHSRTRLAVLWALSRPVLHWSALRALERRAEEAAG